MSVTKVSRRSQVSIYTHGRFVVLGQMDTLGCDAGEKICHVKLERTSDGERLVVAAVVCQSHDEDGWR